MILKFELEPVIYSSAEETLKGLAKFLNYYVLPEKNKVSLYLPYENSIGKKYIVKFKLEVTEIHKKEDN